MSKNHIETVLTQVRETLVRQKCKCEYAPAGGYINCERCDALAAFPEDWPALLQRVHDYARLEAIGGEGDMSQIEKDLKALEARP